MYSQMYSTQSLYLKKIWGIPRTWPVSLTWKYKSGKSPLRIESSLIHPQNVHLLTISDRKSPEETSFWQGSPSSLLLLLNSRHMALINPKLLRTTCAVACVYLHSVLIQFFSSNPCENSWVKSGREEDQGPLSERRFDKLQVKKLTWKQTLT